MISLTENCGRNSPHDEAPQTPEKSNEDGLDCEMHTDPTNMKASNDSFTWLFPAKATQICCPPTLRRYENCEIGGI